MSKRTARIFQDSADEWRVTIVAANGEPIFTSEGYTRRENAEKLIESEYPDAERVEWYPGERTGL